MKDDPAHVSSDFICLAQRCCYTIVLLSLITSSVLIVGCSGDAGKSEAKAKKAIDFDSPKLGQTPRPPAASGSDGQVLQLERDREQTKIAPKSTYAGGKASSREGNGIAGVAKDDAKPAMPVAPKPQEKPKTPAVWHRDASRPSFARVYVGDSNSLELVSLHVSVTIEGPRARTLVDHVFRNPHDRQLEGTFEYPLPPGASPSYYAMFLGASRDTVPARFRPGPATPGKTPIPPESMPPEQLARQIDTADWGTLREARIIPPDKAREAYEEVTRRRIDPALLEYASGNTFRGRVFPIAPRGYNRVILAYEETLSVTDSRLLYRFNLPSCKLHEMNFVLQADPRECKEPVFLPKDARKETGDERVAFSKTWSDATPTGEVVFSAAPAEPTVQAVSGRHPGGGPLYAYARLRPDLPKVAQAEPFAKHAVFLLDTSLSEDPDRFAVSMKLLKAILEGDNDIRHFNVLVFNAGASWVESKGWLPNTKAGRETALNLLDGIVLEGATDLSAAFEKLIAPDFAFETGTPVSCFLLSDGHLTWGQTEPGPLVSKFRRRCRYPVRFCCYRTGLGEENLELYEALTTDGGGVFQCFGQSDVAAAAAAHRRQCLQVESVRFANGLAAEVLVAGRRSAVYPGGELIVAGQFPAAGKTRILLEGTFQGKKFAQSFPVDIRDDGELAARAWGEVAVASLLALNDPWTEDLVTAYCQAFNIASRSASFLVLENDAEYKRLNLDEEKGKTVKGDLGQFIHNAWASLAREPSARQAIGRLLFQINGRIKVLSSAGGEQVKKLLELLPEEDCVLPDAPLLSALLLAKNADSFYLEARKKDLRSVHPYLEECQRRHTAGDVDGAVRVLSSIIEEHPGRGDALRLVGYRLLDMQQPEQAAKLFAEVLRQRPFEPHSFRDLARSLEDARRYPMAALLYEVVLAGTWHGRFGDELKTVTVEEYVRLLRAGVRQGKLNAAQRSFFSERLAKLGSSEVPADLRVSITWNTDNTDVDLWVIEPDGNRVFYSSPRSPSGGVLSQDQTHGYGPERYHIPTARKGEYKILVHYFSANPNLLGGETHVNVVITRHAGTDREKVERRTVILHREKEEKEVARIRY